jgi:DNA-directed RNA polymerase I subunit RPA1
LPVPVYHPVLLEQLLKLLRGRCIYCSRFKCPRQELHLFTCRLRLLRHGLVKAAQEVEGIVLGDKSLRRSGADGDASSDDESLDEDERIAGLMRERNGFVREAIKQAGAEGSPESLATGKGEAILGERRMVLRDFFASITRDKTCPTCKGYVFRVQGSCGIIYAEAGLTTCSISPGFRRDRSNKIFRRPLSEADRMKMVQSERKAVNPLLANLRAEKDKLVRKRAEKRAGREADEGIVADIEDVTEEENGEGEDVEMLEAEEQMADGGLLDTSALMEGTKGAQKTRTAPDEYVNPKEVQAAVEQLFEKERDLLDLVYSSRPASETRSPVSASMFFIKDLLVPPNRYRPDAKTGDGQITEAEQNSLYRKILTQCAFLDQINRELRGSAPESAVRRRDFNDFQNAWVGLQDCVNSLIDSNQNPMKPKGNMGVEEGIKQKLEKKEGLFRMNMMGKRVNFAARSVISPDPNIETNEIVGFAPLPAGVLVKSPADGNRAFPPLSR